MSNLQSLPEVNRELLTPADQELLHSLQGIFLEKTLIRLHAVQQINASPRGTKNRTMEGISDALHCTIGHLSDLACSYRKHALYGIIPKDCQCLSY